MSAAGSSAAQQQLVDLMSREADVELQLRDGSVVMQSAILAVSSNFFADYLSSFKDGAVCHTTEQGLKVIPLPDTTVADWLKVVPFLYPIHPAPQINWDCLDTLLQLSHKYDMPFVQSAASAFLKQHAEQLSSNPASSTDAWKWLLVVDALPGLEGLCGICCDRIKVLYAGQMITGSVAESFAQVTKSTLQQLLTRCRFDGAPAAPAIATSSVFAGPSSGRLL